tara:strand:+ start:85 stop:1209 length:1125 start_codon:yes stop_codon:yes gene_type:complete
VKLCFNKFELSKNKNIKYYYFLDLLRWLAAMSVLTFHYFLYFLFLPSDRGMYLYTDGSNKLINFIQEFVWSSGVGGKAVWFFWCISGFVFTNILVNKKIKLKEFSLKRFFRLYPLHLLTLVLVLILEMYSLYKFNEQQILGAYYDFYHFILNLFFVSGWGIFEKGYSYNHIIWSVSVEIPIYFLFFFIMLYIKENHIIYIFGLLIISWFLIYFGYNKNLMICFFYFIFGSLIYLLCSIFQNYKKSLIFLSIILFLCSFIIDDIEKLIFVSNFKKYIPTLLILFGSLLMFSYFIEDFLFFRKKLSFFGNNSYGIFLLSVPYQLLFLILIEHNILKDDFFYSFKSLAFFLISINILAYFVFKNYEDPIRKKLSSQL